MELPLLALSDPIFGTHARAWSWIILDNLGSTAIFSIFWEYRFMFLGDIYNIERGTESRVSPNTNEWKHAAYLRIGTLQKLRRLHSDTLTRSGPKPLC